MRTGRRSTRGYFKRHLARLFAYFTAKLLANKHPIARLGFKIKLPVFITMRAINSYSISTINQTAKRVQPDFVVIIHSNLPRAPPEAPRWLDAYAPNDGPMTKSTRQMPKRLHISSRLAFTSAGIGE